MNDRQKTRERLVSEVAQLRQRIVELETSNAERRQAAKEAEERQRTDKPLRDLLEIIRFTENVAAKIHGVLDEAEIYRTVKEAFAHSKRYTASIVLLTDDGSSLRVGEVSMPSRKLRAAEKAAGLRLREYKIDLQKSSIYRQVVREGKTVQVSVGDIIGELFPRPLARLISKMMGYENKFSILTPLKRHGKIIGVFAMSSTELAERFIPSVRNLAHHISTALEVADGYAERKRAEEALRKAHDELETRVEQRTAELTRTNEELQVEIAEREQVEQNLRESEVKFRSLAEQLPNMIFINKHGQVLYANKRCAEIMGYAREDFYSADFDFTALTAPEYVDLVRINYARHMRGEEVEPYEYALIAKDGKRVEAIIATRLIDYEGESAILGIITDITERRQAEAERERLLAQVQEQAQRVQEIMDTVPEGVLLLDCDCRVVLANPLGKKDLATLANAQVGDTLTHLGERPLAEVLASPPKGLWHEVAAANRFFQTIARPIENDSTPKGWVFVVRDMTHQRETERRAQQQERLAAVGQLAAGIAHDFNNFLTTIMLYAQLLLRKPQLPADLAPSVETILDESRRAAQLVRQILDFSRRSMLEIQPVDLVSFTQEINDLLRRTLPENVRLLLEIGPEEYVVNADSTRIQQAVMNLALNARDAMPEGGELRIGLSRTRVKPGEAPPVAEMGAGEWVCLAVSDTGTGIPPDVLPHMYEPYFTTKAPGKGTGLGLAQVDGIVKQHRGHIGVETEVGCGTTFRVYLPVHKVEGQEKVAEGAAAPPKGQGEIIMLVEDEDGVREAGREILESLGYRVLIAADAQEALSVYRSAERVDLVLTDIVMPGMGGKELVRELRKTGPHARALAITGYTLVNSLSELREEGILGIVQKPLEVNTLAEAVRRALDVSDS